MRSSSRWQLQHRYALLRGKESYEAAPQPIGLDVGTSRVVTARPASEGYAFNEQLNAFVDLPWSNLTAGTLRKEGIPHAADGSRIIVLGSESARFADLLGIETRRSMLRGVLNPGEPEGLTQIRRLLEHVIGAPEGKGQKLCFSVPAPTPGSEENITYHEASLRQILSEIGYDPRGISEGLAVVYAELESSNYSGIGISFGGGLCNVCLAYLSVPVATFSVAKAETSSTRAPRRRPANSSTASGCARKRASTSTAMCPTSAAGSVGLLRRHDLDRGRADARKFRRLWAGTASSPCLWC